MAIQVTNMWMEEEMNYQEGKYYRPGGVHGVVLSELFLDECMEDPEKYDMLTRLLLKPRNPLIRRHLQQLSKVPVDSGETISAQTQVRVSAYHGHLMSKTPLPTGTDDVSEMYISRVLPLFFLPSQELEMWVDGELEDALRKDPKYERKLESRILENVERLVFKRLNEESGGTTDIMSDAYEAEIFETRLIEQYPDYFSVLDDLGWPMSDIPLNPYLLPSHLSAAYERASLRVELKLKAGCFGSKKRSDIKYALDVIDRKYKDKAQPFFQPIEEPATTLPAWLSGEVLSALEERFQASNPPGKRQPVKLPKGGTLPPRKKVVESESL